MVLGSPFISCFLFNGHSSALLQCTVQQITRAWTIKGLLIDVKMACAAFLELYRARGWWNSEKQLRGLTLSLWKKWRGVSLQDYSVNCGDLLEAQKGKVKLTGYPVTKDKLIRKRKVLKHTIWKKMNSGVLVGHFNTVLAGEGGGGGGGEKGWELERINLQKFRSQGEAALIDRHIREPD